MAAIFASFLLFFYAFPIAFSASVLDDLINLHPPSDFNATITNNCLRDPSLRYCNFSPSDLPEIFKSTIVASHLCNVSNNPNCVEYFPKIDLRGHPKIAPLYLSFSFFWKYCPLTILWMDISNCSLKGAFPSDVLLCTQIQSLDLSDNYLSGDIPVENFSPLTNLTFLNLSYNQFSETKVPDSDLFKRFTSSSFIRSGLLRNPGEPGIKAIVLLIISPVLLILVTCFLGSSCLKQPNFLRKMFTSKHKFTVTMLKAATNGFSKQNLVGTSEGVDIYVGILKDGSEMRIEIYRDDISREQRRRFVQECKLLVQMSHGNLIRVLGWCNARRLRAVITEWTNGENVENWLKGSAPKWKQRLKLLTGVVQGMRYLQDEWPDIGYDLRTCSVLLSDKHEPLISRFEVGNHISSRRRVHRYGVFLLEVVANKRAREEFQRGEEEFIEWVRINYPGNVQEVIDERMQRSGNNLDQAAWVIGLGLMCTDLSTSQQLSLVQIERLMVEAYELSQANASPKHEIKREKNRT